MRQTSAARLLPIKPHDADYRCYRELPLKAQVTSLPLEGPEQEEILRFAAAPKAML